MGSPDGSRRKVLESSDGSLEGSRRKVFGMGSPDGSRRKVLESSDGSQKVLSLESFVVRRSWSRWIVVGR
jgi:hypothetical protein